jgi:hypothetical protein
LIFFYLIYLITSTTTQLFSGVIVWIDAVGIDESRGCRLIKRLEPLLAEVIWLDEKKTFNPNRRGERAFARYH